MRHRPVRLLVIEDSLGYRQVIRTVFANRNGPYEWDVTEAMDGTTALRLISANGNGAVLYVPDLILLDWNLPGMSGSEVLQYLKGHSELKKTPVLIFSTSEEERDIQEAYTHHANGFITKPRTLSVLFQVAEAIETFWIAVAQLTSFGAGAPPDI